MLSESPEMEQGVAWSVACNVRNSNLDIKPSSLVLSWWLLVLPIGASIFGWGYLGQDSFPPMYGTFLEAAVHQLIGPNRARYLGSELVLLWGLTAVIGLAASLAVIAVNDWKPTGKWRWLRLLSLGTLPSVLLTARLYMFPPFIFSMFAGMLFLPTCALASVVCLVVIVKNKVPPSQKGILTVCQLLAWSALGLFAADSINRFMLGVS